MMLGALSGDLDAKRYRTFLESRLPYLPALRRRAVPVPFALDRPVWEDDPNIDLDHHLRHRTVPAPGDARAVSDTVASVLAVPLDPHRPLWEAWFLDGLADDAVAVLFKVHHAAPRADSPACACSSTSAISNPIRTFPLPPSNASSTHRPGCAWSARVWCRWERSHGGSRAWPPR